MNLPEEFLRRMEQRLGQEYPAFLQSYEKPPYRALRVNTLKISLEDFFRDPPFPLGAQVDWEERIPRILRGFITCKSLRR